MSIEYKTQLIYGYYFTKTEIDNLWSTLRASYNEDIVENIFDEYVINLNMWGDSDNFIFGIILNDVEPGECAEIDKLRPKAYLTTNMNLTWDKYCDAGFGYKEKKLYLANRIF